MKIGIDIRHLTDPRPAGVGGYTKQLLAALFRLDQENEYILFATGTPWSLRRLPKFDFPNVKKVLLTVPNKVMNGTILITGGPTLESLVPGHLLDRWFFPNLNFISTKLPYVITAHDLSYEIFPEFFSAKMRLWHKAVQPKRIFQNASVILAPSTSTKRDLELFYGIDADKIHVAPLAAGGSVGAEVPAYRLPPRYLLTLGTLEPRKNHLSIIEAYEAYRDQSHDPIALVIAGSLGWKSTPIVRAINRSKYTKDIQLIDYISEEQKLRLYRDAQAFLFPSFYEGFGLPVLEAMQAGCPVITANTSSLPELTAGAAILVDPFNVNDVVVAMKLLLSSDRLRSDLIKKGLGRAALFSWEGTARATLRVLKK